MQMSQLIKRSFVFLLFGILTAIVFLLSLHEGMFWDNVLFASKMGNHLYQYGLFNINIPIEFDPGHPPFLAFINALGWKLLGHKLWVSHLVMTPFIFGFFIQLYRFVGHFIGKPVYRSAAFILICADPTLSSHLIQVNPQIIQLFFFLLAINGIISKKSIYKILGLAFLGIVTFRGMMMCAGVFLFELINHLINDRKSFPEFFKKQLILEYLLAAIPACSYVVWRLITKGWLQTHPGSPWSSLWQFAGITDFLRNIAVLVNRYLDFGRIGIFLFLLYILIRKRKLFQNTSAKSLLILAICVDVVTIVVSLFSKNAMGHRYFMASYMAFTLLAFFLLIEMPKIRVWIYSVLLLLLITGNLWIYPDTIAQGWDSTLAHVPYFKLRSEAIQYMNNHQIPVEQTASFFPNSVQIDMVDFSGDHRSFQPFTGNNEYVFYSNVYNLTDVDFNLLQKRYKSISTFSRCRIRVVLYKKIQ
jgi:hypothetical protein